MKAPTFLKNQFLWLVVYAIVVTGVFLYLLFPSSLVLQRLKSAAVSVGWNLEAEALHPSVPLGLKLSNVKIQSSEMPGEEIFQGQFLDLQISLFSFFKKRKRVSFHGRAYGGDFNGSAGFILSDRKYQSAEWKVTFQQIDLARCNMSGVPLLKGMTGWAKGSGMYEANSKADHDPAGNFALYLTRGSYPLPEPFLGVSRIDFDRGELQAQLKSGKLTIQKFDVYGEKMNCFLKGDIQLAPRYGESQLQLKGVLEIAGKTKIKMNITVGGTLANPSFRYM